jgi:hypothetical protein
MWQIWIGSGIHIKLEVHFFYVKNIRRKRVTVHYSHLFVQQRKLCACSIHNWVDKLSILSGYSGLGLFYRIILFENLKIIWNNIGYYQYHICYRMRRISSWSLSTFASISGRFLKVHTISSKTDEDADSDQKLAIPFTPIAATNQPCY